MGCVKAFDRRQSYLYRIALEEHTAGRPPLTGRLSAGQRDTLRFAVHQASVCEAVRLTRGAPRQEVDERRRIVTGGATAR
jgi:hypothetical protein